MLAFLDLLFTFPLAVWTMAFFGPYALGTFCPEGVFSYTNDCIALLGTRSTAGTFLTLVVQIVATGVGTWYATRLLFFVPGEESNKKLAHAITLASLCVWVGLILYLYIL